MGDTSYVIALGSNRRHGRHGAPERVVLAALDALAGEGMTLLARSTIRATPAIGGAGRRFANAAAVIATLLPPPELLSVLKRIERRFGRRPGRRWGPRVLDLDILLWSGGRYHGGSGASSLVIPHPRLVARGFVLQPLLEIAPAWRHPALGLTVPNLWHRLRRSKPVAPATRLP